LGRPTGPSSGDPNMFFRGEGVAYAANQAYDKVAPSQVGEIRVFSLMSSIFA